jgi:hypothetical protein
MNIKEYENRIIAFIDILGMKEELLRKKSCAEIYEILTIFEELQKGAFHNVCEKERKYLFQDIKYQILSDTFVISFLDPRLPDPFLEEEGLEDDAHDLYLGVNLNRLTFVLIELQNILLLKYKILIRGAITSGKLYHNNGVIFGEALVNAYNMEKDHACYPRIIYDEALLKRYNYEKLRLDDSDYENSVRRNEIIEFPWFVTKDDYDVKYPEFFIRPFVYHFNYNSVLNTMLRNSSLLKNYSDDSGKSFDFYLKKEGKTEYVKLIEDFVSKKTSTLKKDCRIKSKYDWITYHCNKENTPTT